MFQVIPRFLTLLLDNNKWSLPLGLSITESQSSSRESSWFLLCRSTLQGTLPVSRHFLFVSDAVDAFLLVLEKGVAGQVYNVGTSFEIPIAQLAQELVRMVGFVRSLRPAGDGGS